MEAIEQVFLDSPEEVEERGFRGIGDWDEDESEEEKIPNDNLESPSIEEKNGQY